MAFMDHLAHIQRDRAFEREQWQRMDAIYGCAEAVLLEAEQRGWPVTRAVVAQAPRHVNAPPSGAMGTPAYAEACKHLWHETVYAAVIAAVIAADPAALAALGRGLLAGDLYEPPARDDSVLEAFEATVGELATLQTPVSPGSGSSITTWSRG